jgi:enoyl-CoA hydratase
VGLVYRCVPDDKLAAAAHAMAAKAAGGPRALAMRMKDTMRQAATLDSHDAAVELEVGPQVWSTRQPWFTERLAAIQARISSKE